MAQNNQNGKMSREEAGRKGGEATSKNHDHEFYQEIGSKGGEATSKNHDKDFYQEIGSKGGKQHPNLTTVSSIKRLDVKAEAPGAAVTEMMIRMAK